MYKTNLLKNNKGQGFIEFVLLMAVLLSISLTLRNLVRGNIKDQWTLMVKLITTPKPGSPSDSDLKTN